MSSAEVTPAALRQAAQELVPIFYADLKRLARRIRSGVRAGNTLQTTALIHEAYLKLYRTPGWNDRQHFLRAAALAMRQVLVDDARARLAQSRNAGERPLSLEDVGDPAAAADDERVLSMHEAIEQLAGFSPRLAQVVECRYFAGYTEPETAVALGLSVATVERDWAKARSWLHQYLKQGAD